GDALGCPPSRHLHLSTLLTLLPRRFSLSLKHGLHCVFGESVGHVLSGLEAGHLFDLFADYLFIFRHLTSPSKQAAFFLRLRWLGRIGFFFLNPFGLFFSLAALFRDGP